MVSDFRYALRTLRQNPGFAATAILSIALAIGANSSIFSMADGLVLRPLPVPDASRIVSIRALTSERRFSNLSYADYLDIREKSRSFDGLVAYSMMPMAFAKDGRAQAEITTGFLVSGNFFHDLHVDPQLGRGFRPDEDQVPGRDAVVVLSHDLWQAAFGSDAKAVGQTLRLNGIDFTIIGVTSASFTGIQHIVHPSLYVPAAMAPKLAPADTLLTNRARREFFVKGRLKDGISIQAAESEISGIARALEQSFPTTNQGIGTAVRTELQARAEFSPPDPQLAAVLSILVAVVLLIACANVANLMLNRGENRVREIAVRLSVGATRRRILWQLMTESFVIALIGGIAGLALTAFAVDAFSRVKVIGDLPIGFTFRLDYRVAAFTLLASAVSSILFGLAPALHSMRTDLVTALKTTSSDRRHKRLLGTRALVVVQIAGSLVLAIATTQLYRDIAGALADNPGFAVDHRITMRFDPNLIGYSPAQTEQFYRTLLDRVRGLPGVTTAALSASLPMTTNFSVLPVVPEGYSFPEGRDSETVLVDYVTDAYFETLATPVIAGRGFLPADRLESRRVAVVNAEFAQRFFKGSAVGKRLRAGRNDEWIEIVGVTPTGRHLSPFEPPMSFLYLPSSQHPQARMTLIAKTEGHPEDASASLRSLLRSIDPNVPIFAVRTMDEIFKQRGVDIARFVIGTVAALGGIGLLLALVGLYAVVAYQVSRRTREIGIRMALGAARLQVLRMVLKYAAGMVITGVAIGLMLGITGSRALGATMLSRQIPFQPIWLIATVAILLATTMLAAAIPALHASRIDPQRALRQE